MTLEEHIRRYLELVNHADEIFRAVAEAHPERIACKPGCDDCCSVYFELSLIEAFYLSAMFRRWAPGAAAERILERARETAGAYRDARGALGAGAGREGRGPRDLEDEASRVRIACPLKEMGRCALYEDRPITCRLYGTPEKIRGRVISCPKSGFDPGERYMTVDVDQIQRRLFEYSRDLLQELIDVTISQRPGILFSPAEALETEFDKAYFLSLKKSLS